MHVLLFLLLLPLLVIMTLFEVAQTSAFWHTMGGALVVVLGLIGLRVLGSLIGLVFS